MSDRSRAIAVLREARDVLLKRLGEGVLESELEILDDAHGLSYSGQIESLNDQIGSRLANLNGLLAHLQAAEAEAQLIANPAREGDTISLELLVNSDPMIVVSPDGHDLLFMPSDESNGRPDLA